MHPSPGNLSARGCKASLPTRNTVIWDVLSDLQSPSNPSGFISLGVAENALMHSELSSYLARIPPPPATAFTYGDGPTGSKRLKTALSAFLSKSLKSLTPIEPSHIAITSGVTAAIEHASWALCDPGEGMLLGQPHYGAFVDDISMRPGTRIVKVSFGDIDPIGSNCASRYEDALLEAKAKGVKAKALMLCNPHNPLGRCYGRGTLVEIMKLCAKWKLHLISDEIYAFSVFANRSCAQTQPFTSISSIPPSETGIDPSYIHILWGLSKDFGANGLRLGCLISQSNPSLLSTIRTVGLHSAPSSLVDHAATTILEDTSFTAQYIKTNQQRLAESYEFVASWADKHQIPYAQGVNAAFFLWCNFGVVWTPSKDGDPSQTLTAQIMRALMDEKIFLASGESFGSEEEGWFRIVFSQPRNYIEEGLKRILNVLGIEESRKDGLGEIAE